MTGKGKQEHILFLGSMFITVLASQATMLVDASVGGNCLGPDAVSAVDLVMPVYEVFYALVMLLGMGACTVSSLCLGRGDIEAVRRHFTAAVISSFSFMLLLGAGIFFFSDSIVTLLCNGSYLRSLTHDYLLAMVPFFVAAGISMLLMMFTAMAGRPFLVMCCAVAQFALNLLCNLLLIKLAGMGIEALAYSSALASVATLLMLLPAYFSKRCPFQMIWCTPLQFMDAFGDNIKYGSGFIAVEASYIVMAYSMNSLVLRFFGEQGLFFWSVVMMIYLACDYASVAAQETSLSLGGRLLGAGDDEGAGQVNNRSLVFALSWIILILSAVFAFPRFALPLFGAPDVEVYPSLLQAIAVSIPFLAGVCLGNLFLIRLVQRGKIMRYVILSSSLFLAVPVVFLLAAPFLG